MDCINNFWCFLKSSHQQISIMFSFITLVLAFYGLNSWRKQINGTNQIKLAKSLLSQIYLIKDLFINSRLKAFWVYEEPINKSLNEKEKLRFKLDRRLLPISEALMGLEKDYYQAYVEWGLHNSKHLSDLKSLYFEYIQAVNMFLEYYDIKGAQEGQEAYKIIFSNNLNDDFMDRFNSVVIEFDDWLRPKFQGIIKRNYIRFKRKK